MNRLAMGKIWPEMGKRRRQVSGSVDQRGDHRRTDDRPDAVDGDDQTDQTDWQIELADPRPAASAAPAPPPDTRLGSSNRVPAAHVMASRSPGPRPLTSASVRAAASHAPRATSRPGESGPVFGATSRIVWVHLPGEVTLSSGELSQRSQGCARLAV